jgi:myo-inositol 2-dehydrogenase/D-chiro-inositol 1-dehydrogenase
VTATPIAQEYDPCAGDQELFADAYNAELAAFVAVVRAGSAPPVTGEDARAALVIALAAAESVRAGRPMRLEEVEK